MLLCDETNKIAAAVISSKIIVSISAGNIAPRIVWTSICRRELTAYGQNAVATIVQWGLREFNKNSIDGAVSLAPSSSELTNLEKQ